ncbi:hypothetical protein B0T26DRAFT_776642 [Lasiosphaeria miniovina]|uniref:CHAT domain-containing protein n=1 Tax=Lasiosphaeria miniovina TaxID=1954250 RepID=A0AA40AKY2_9PEZI|nr:uncharacterized protein B0T26DRAFT_776642 [Lasiosphaeria miniovina]KAK0717748.1 hypothetical protein B0T26DRAFT_776642 [Lasiosphaeria miniovina]
MRKDNVLQHLQTCKIFHFAGHGQTDPKEPSRSCLLLEDWKTNPLTVGDLRDYRLQENGPFLGYLLACSTGSNEAAKLADEGIHLDEKEEMEEEEDEEEEDEEEEDEKEDEKEEDEKKRDRKARDATLKLSGLRVQKMANPYWIPYIHFGV